MLGLHCCVGFSLDARSGGYSSLLCMGSTVCGLNSCGSQAIGHRLNGCGAHRLSCSLAYGIFPDQGLNPCLLHWGVDSKPFITLLTRDILRQQALVSTKKNQQYLKLSQSLLGFPGKESTCSAGDLGLTPGLGRWPWRRRWLPTLVLSIMYFCFCF